LISSARLTLETFFIFRFGLNKNGRYVTGFALMLWIKEDLQQPEHSRQPDDNGRSKTQQLLSTTANGLKRIILRSQPEIQVKIKIKSLLVF
jgi:hypothetical protein